MKKMLLLLFPVLIILVACKKNGVLEPVPNESWWSLGIDTSDGYTTYKKTTYNVTELSRKIENGYFILLGTDATPSLDTIRVCFSTEPMYSKKYKVVGFDRVIFGYKPPLDTNQIGIKISIPWKSINSNSTVFYSAGVNDNILWRPADSIDVSVNNGKIKVNIPRMMAIGFGSTSLDSIQLQGVLIEK